MKIIDFPREHFLLEQHYRPMYYSNIISFHYIIFTRTVYEICSEWQLNWKTSKEKCFHCEDRTLRSFNCASVLLTLKAISLIHLTSRSLSCTFKLLLHWTLTKVNNGVIGKRKFYEHWCAIFGIEKYRNLYSADYSKLILNICTGGLRSLK